MQYRSEIDGLRALALIPVILFHAGFELFSGGFIGVDVFFVISGYLITSILIEDIEKKRFSILNFYERRARRILPALFLVMVFCIPFAFFWMLPDQIKDFSQSLIAVGLFASNIFFQRKNDYFAPNSEEVPLLHTWSLAVEEQYYFFFPIFLIAAWRFKKNRVFWVVVIVSIISFLISELRSNNNVTANFYFTTSRAWELFAGSISAFIVQKKGIQKNNAFAFLGIAMIVFSIYEYNEEVPFPSAYTLLPVLGTVLLILYASKGTIVAKFLSLKAFVGIGLISYSAYLWHQPIFAFARIRLNESPSFALMLFLSFTSIVFGYISWKYVEKPFRNKEKITQKKIFKASIIGIILFVIIGLTGYHNVEKFEAYWLNKQTELTKKTYSLLNDAKNNSPVTTINLRYDDQKCRFNVLNINSSIENRLLNCHKKYGSGTLIFGDSHATNLYHSIVRNSENHKTRFIVGITKNGCHLPTIDSNCQYSKLLDFISKNPNIFNSAVYEKAGFLMLKFHKGREKLRESNSKEAKINKEVINGVINYLEKISKYLSVNWFGPRIEPGIGKKELLHHTCDGVFNLSKSQIKSYTKLDDFLKSNLRNSEINYISQNQSYKFSFPDDFGDCEGLYWFDGNHFSPLGETKFGNRFNILKAIINKKK